MRKYVLEFLQDNIIALQLKANEIFILSYLVEFFNSGNAKMCFIDGKRYYYITYNKNGKVCAICTVWLDSVKPNIKTDMN